MADGDVTISVTLDTTDIKQKIDELKHDLQELANEANQAGMTDRFTEITNILTTVSQQLQQLTNQMQNFGSNSVNTQQANQQLEAYANQLATVNARYQAHGNNVVRYGTRIVGALNNIRRTATRAFNFGGLTTGIRRIAQVTIGVYSMYSALIKFKQAIKTGINNLVQFESETNETNAAMTEFTTSLLYLKNAWGAAFAPILNVVLPVLSELVNRIAEVGNAIARFVGTLTGQAQVLNAVRVSAGDYAKKLQGVGSSAKKASDRLAAFDDLNVLGKDTDSGGGSDTPDPSEMFEYVDAVNDIAEMIKSAIGNGFDFTEVGAQLANNIKLSLEEVNSHWGEIQETAYNIGTGLATFLNGLFGDTTMFSTAGTTVAEALNTVGQAIRGFFDSYDMGTIGTSIAEFFRGLFTDFDWQTAGANFGDTIKLIFTEAASFIKNFPTEEMVDGIFDFFAGIDWPGVVASIVDFAASSVSFVGVLLEEIGKNLGEIEPDDIINFFEDIDWEAVAQGIADLFVGAVTLILGTAKFISSMVIALGTALGDALYGLSKDAGYTDEDILERPGEAIIAGLLHGMEVALEGIGTWIENSIINPIVDNFCEMLGIHSPSTVFEAFGIDIIQGLLNGINSLIEDVTAIFTTLQETIEGIWSDIISTAITKWVELKTNITNKVQDIKDKVTEKVTDLKDKLSETWQNIKDNAYEKFVLMRVAIVEVFRVLGEAIKTPINAVLSTMESWINKIIDGINSLIGGMGSVADTFGDLASAVGLPTLPSISLSHVSLPRLAQGAVIPPNKEFMAVLGDQSSGTNIEAPLDTIKQAVQEVVGSGDAEIIALLQQLIAVVESKNLSIGDKEIGRANARYTNQQNRIRGVGF
jgi:ElaB/YqjD/DUF883 family membrane-anchored ribosome-binding protein